MHDVGRSANWWHMVLCHQSRSMNVRRTSFTMMCLYLILVISIHHRYQLLSAIDNMLPTTTSAQEETPPWSTIDNSVLLQWDDLQNKSSRSTLFTPGIFPYNSNNKNLALYITGASITGDYRKEDNSLWLQMYGLGEMSFTNDLPLSCTYSSPEFSNQSSKRFPHQQKSWINVQKERFDCQIIGGNHNRRGRFMFIPTRGWDPNTNNLLQIWRCLLYGDGEYDDDYDSSVLSEMDRKRFLQGYNDQGSELILPIQILHVDPMNENSTTVVTQFFFPASEPNVGMNQIHQSSRHNRSSSTKKQPPNTMNKPFLQRRYNMTLCMVVEPNGLSTVLMQHLRYHFDELGIDHVHLGLQLRDQNSLSDPELMKSAHQILRHEIDQGLISLASIEIDKNFHLDCPKATRMAIFYQDCLYRAKSTSEFLGTWDVDEYLVLRNKNHKNNTNQNLTDHVPNNKKVQKKKMVDLLREISHPPCQDWSFVTMKSVNAGVRKNESRSRVGLIAHDYPHQDKEPNIIYRKSILRTKNVFLNSFHLPGSVLLPGVTNISEVVEQVLENKKDTCAFYWDGAIMVHNTFVFRPIQDDYEPSELRPLLLGLQ